jgi:acetamidase/formamidase
MILSFQHKEEVRVNKHDTLLLPDICKYKTNVCGLKSWDREDMVKAIRAACNKKIGSTAASKKCNVPHSVLCNSVHLNWYISQAVQVVSQNTISYPFSVVKEAVGKSWFKCPMN